MAVQPWKAYNRALFKIGNGTISLASTAFRLTLHKSTSNAATLTLSVYNSVTNEVTEANGYSSSGKPLANEVWTVGQSGGEYKFDADDVVWTASGTITSIMFAVIALSAAASANRHLLCFASLTSSPFAVSTGNTLTIAMNANGILTMVRG